MNRKDITTFAKKLRGAFDEAEVTAVARETGFTRRVRDIAPLGMALSVIGSLATQPVKVLADLTRAFNALTGGTVDYKPFHNQLAKRTFPKFMEGLFLRCLDQLILKVLEPLSDSLLLQFEDIVIQDGSSFAIKDTLRRRFPGRFTATNPAAVEVHATMSVLHDQVLRAAIAPDSQAERDFLPEAAQLKGKLLLADRGYESLEYCQQIDKANGFFLIRFKRNINPTVVEVRVGSRRRLSLRGRKFQDILADLRGKSADLDVEWRRRGESITFRLVLFWNKEEKKHTILGTNLIRDQFEVAQVGQLYRLRWQIELLFKEWKSYANLHAFDTSKPGIVEGLIWASMTAALVKRFLAHAAEGVAQAVAMSTQRVAKMLSIHLPGLLRALLCGRGVTKELEPLLLFLRRSGRRAHPRRDAEKGRLAQLRHATSVHVSP